MQGPTGGPGPAGVQGPSGAQGPQGAQGTAPTGSPGAQGSTGATGPAGVQGPSGAQGPQGAQGTSPTGSPGAQGSTGGTGPAGVQGPAGAQGPQGAQGTAPTGSTGPSGAQGPQGGAGTPGATGPQGPQGPQGPTGPSGTQGPAGGSGPAGAQGGSGPTGSPGPTGPTGSGITQSNSLGVNTPGSGTAGEIRATGNITAAYSDQRLKTIKGRIDNALDKVNQIKGVSYYSNELAESFGYKDKSRQIGVIAQDMQKVLPEVVAPAPFDSNKYGSSISNERYLTVMYERIVPLLIEALKEQKEQIDYIKSNL